MNGWSEFLNTLRNIRDLILVLVALITAILALRKVAPEFWELVIKPGLKLLGFAAVLVIPYVILIWIFLSQAARNSDRLWQAPVFLSLVAYMTVPIVLYGVIWGVWIYPGSKAWLPGRKHAEKQPAHKPHPPASAKNKKEADSGEQEINK